jgi:hypothetical protein
VAAKPWDSNGAPTLAEQRLEEQLGQGSSWGGHRVAEPPEPLNVHAEDDNPEREVRGAYLTRLLIESPDEAGWRPFGRQSAQPPVIQIEDSIITGHLDLRAADLPYLLEFVRCRFQHPPDLRQTMLAGLVFANCRFPGLHARNLGTRNDTQLLSCTSTGLVNLTDAQIDGSLILNDSELRNPQRRAVHADRLSVAGALLGLRLRVSGELRIPGSKIGGNVNISGGALRNRGHTAMNATGIQISGSLRCDVDPRSGKRFTAAGRLYLPSAHIAGDLRLRDAIIEPGTSPPQRGESSFDDPICTLITDRGEIRGDVQLDQDFQSGGTIRMVSTKIGGDLRMSGARVDLSWTRSAASVEQPPRTLHLDGTEILGNLDAGRVVLHGQVRMVDVRVRGGFQLSRAKIVGPRTEVMQANRIQVGSDFDCREADIEGSMQLQGAQIGANVDLRSTHLSRPARHRHRDAFKSSLDLRAARVGRDLVCAKGAHPFSAQGEVQLRRAVIGRQANFWSSLLGDGCSTNAINGFGLVAQELSMLPAEPPQGRILLRQAQCELLADNETLWQASGGVDVDDFSYDNFSLPVEPTDQARVRERLKWLRTTSKHRYQPGPYDQLATVFRNNGNEEHAGTVLIEKQRRRYQAIASASRPPLRPTVHLWSWLQRITVSYGYRPLRALLWLVLFAAAGTGWFSFHPLEPISHEEHPVWNPFLYTVDQLLPIINLGNKVMWRAEGGSQWITAVLIAMGWILATTVAAGVTRALRRER